MTRHGLRAGIAIALASVICTAACAQLRDAVAPLAIDVTRPVRISWPLDVGPDISADRKDGRVCLRARQGANELQMPGGGKALYAFRAPRDAEYRTYFRVRWTDDGLGGIECNNSWFVGFDDRPVSVIESKPRWNRHTDNAWHWEQGPNVRLSTGVHWLRVELREDGVLMDRVAMVPVGDFRRRPPLDALKPLTCEGLVGERPPFNPQHPIQDLECWALPTRSLVIGKGHANEITVGASWHGKGADGFQGTIDVRCATAPEVKVTGSRKIACGPSHRFAKSILTLDFPESAPRRFHRLEVRIINQKRNTVFQDEIRLVKGYAWAFLGPFRRDRGNRTRARTPPGPLPEPRMPCDETPLRLAHLESTEALGLKDAAAAGDRPVQWRIISDGSCYDWTGAVDLTRLYGRRHFAFAYAVTWIQAQTRLRHRSFRFQADDAGWLWANGRFLAVLPVNVPREANRLWSSASLHPGSNPVVVKLTQNAGHWGFRFDVVDWHWQGRRGDVITGAEPATWPKPRR